MTCYGGHDHHRLNMNILLVLTLAVGLVTADIGLTYNNNYQVPQTSYGVPSYQYNSGGNYNTGYSGATGYNYKAQNTAQTGYQGSSFGQQSAGHETGYQSNSLGEGSSNSGFQTGSNRYQNNGVGSLSTAFSSVSQPTVQFNEASSTAGYQNYNHNYNQQYQSQYQTSAVQKYQEFYNQWQQQPAQVFKHFYVHAAPEEPEIPKVHQPVVLPPPQKHYKIIFIKAPSQTVYEPKYIPVPQQNEEKTIVYVLVKKPEVQQEVTIPKFEQKPPTKPEVFFIKYNNKADSQAVINNIVNDYSKDGSSSSAVASGSVGSEGLSTSTGQYNTGSNLFGQGSTGQYSQGGYSGQYVQGAQTGSQSSTSGFGQTLSVGSSSTSAATGNYESSTSSSSATSNLNFGNLNAISTSQGVPHESYGPPKFRV